MKLLFETYPYDAKDLLKELGFDKNESNAEYDFEACLKDFEVCFKDVPHTISKNKDYISFSGVGNCYSGFIKDSVYILPRVFVNVFDSKTRLVFGRITNKDEVRSDPTIQKNAKVDDKTIEGYLPEKIVSIGFSKDSKEKEGIAKTECSYISDIACWVHESVLRYISEKGTGILLEDGELVKVSLNPGETSITFVETIENLKRFYKAHRTFFTFIAVNRRSGNANVNWRKTISTQQAYLQSNKPVYTTFISKAKSINFDEEVVVMFLSVMNYLRNKFYFGPVENPGYDLIRTSEIEKLIESGKGVLIMKKMRHKYFSDELVHLCKLLLAFFEKAYDVAANPMKSEVTLVKKYDRVFEHMIDCLIGDELPKALKYMKNQNDGKNIDHIFLDRSLVGDDSDSNQIFYIGDSKYYKEDSNLTKKPISKQYTYAKNIIQYCMNIFNKRLTYDENLETYNEDDNEQLKERKAVWKEEIELGSKVKKYRDPLTEGYSITPNFFIQGRVFPDRREFSDEFTQEDLIKNQSKKGEDEDNRDVDADWRMSFQFKNRLFDRDTLILQTYDINFLYLLAVYVRRCESESTRNRIRKVLRDNILEVINSKFDIYRLTQLKTEDAINDFMDSYSRVVAGRVFSFEKDNEYHFYIALGKEEKGQYKVHDWSFLSVKNFALIEKSNKKSGLFITEKVQLE